MPDLRIDVWTERSCQVAFPELCEAEWESEGFEVGSWVVVLAWLVWFGFVASLEMEGGDREPGCCFFYGYEATVPGLFLWSLGQSSIAMDTDLLLCFVHNDPDSLPYLP